MVDCALLTERGIVFCFLPTGLFQTWKEKLRYLAGNTTIEVGIGTASEHRIYYVRPELILVRYQYGN